jgi:hypothetical protein
MTYRERFTASEERAHYQNIATKILREVSDLRSRGEASTTAQPYMIFCIFARVSICDNEQDNGKCPCVIKGLPRRATIRGKLCLFTLSSKKACPLRLGAWGALPFCISEQPCRRMLVRLGCRPAAIDVGHYLLSPSNPVLDCSDCRRHACASFILSQLPSGEDTGGE